VVPHARSCSKIPRTFIRSMNDIVKTSSWVTVLLLTLLTGRIVEFAREVL